MANPTIIAPQTRIAGSITGTEDVTVEGYVEGAIRLDESLFVAGGGQVHGDIAVRIAQIDGTVVGDIQATERVILGASARVKATIQAPLIEMADGAQLSGELTIGVEGMALATTTTAARPATTTRPVTTSARPATTPRPATKPARSTPASPAAAASQSAVTTTVVEEVVEEAEVEAPQEQASSAPGLPDIEEMSFDEVDEDFTVKELREELRKRDLAVSGTKAELIERLMQAESESAT